VQSACVNLIDRCGADVIHLYDAFWLPLSVFGCHCSVLRRNAVDGSSASSSVKAASNTSTRPRLASSDLQFPRYAENVLSNGVIFNYLEWPLTVILRWISQKRYEVDTWLLPIQSDMWPTKLCHCIANDLDCSLMYFSYLLFQLFRSENNCSLLFRPLIKSPGIRRRMTLPMIFRPGTRWQQNLIRQNRIRLCGLRQCRFRQCRVFVALLSKVDCRRLVRLCRTTVERRLTWIFMSHVMIQPLVTSFVSPKRTNWREVECGSLLWCRQWC